MYTTKINKCKKMLKRTERYISIDSDRYMIVYFDCDGKGRLPDRVSDAAASGEARAGGTGKTVITDRD